MTQIRATIHRTPWILFMLAAWALLNGLAYPRVNFWLLSHVAIVPLTLLALKGAPRKRVLLWTYLAAACWWAVMLHWIIPVTAPGYVALSAYLALYPTAYVWLLPRVYRRFNPPLTLSVPVVWVALEWVRGAWVLTGFPWFLQGQSQPTLMIQSADLVGAYGVSFVVCATNGLLCDLATRPLIKRDGREKLDMAHGAFASVLLWALLLGGGLVYGAVRLGQWEAVKLLAGEPLRVAVVQTNVPQSNKEFPTDEQDEANFAEMLRLSEQTLTDKPDLIVWPETMVPNAIDDESAGLFGGSRDNRDRLRAFVAQHGVPMLVGAHAMVGWHESGDYLVPSRRYNSAYLITEKSASQRYDKVHRVPFGEYLPWVENWDWGKRMLLKLTPYSHDYTLTPGHGVEVFQVGGWSIASPICFEDVVTYLPRKMVYKAWEKRADLLVNISNDGWFAGSVAVLQHEQVARFRCVENRVPMARAVNTGVSGFIDSCGRVTERVTVGGRSQQVAGTLTLPVYKDTRRAVYGLIGDTLPLGCLVLTALGTVWGGLSGPRGQKGAERVERPFDKAKV